MTTAPSTVAAAAAARRSSDPPVKPGRQNVSQDNPELFRHQEIKHHIQTAVEYIRQRQQYPDAPQLEIRVLHRQNPDQDPGQPGGQ